MNDATTAAQALLTLSRSSAARTQVARLRELLPQIEAAQAAGVKHALIVEALNAHGFDLSLKAYSVMLYRLRQARAKKPEASAATKTPQLFVTPSPAATPAASSTDPKPGEPNRFDWDTLKNTPPEW